MIKDTELNKLTFKELITLESKITKLKDKLKKEEQIKVKKDIQVLIDKVGIPLDEIYPELFKTKTKKIIKSKAKPKYQNPDDNTQTWSGRGKTPLWAIPHKENGTLNDCLIGRYIEQRSLLPSK